MTDETEKTKGKKSPDPNAYPDRLVQISAVIQLTSLSRTQIHRLCKEPAYAHLKFPQPIRIGAQRMAWSLPAIRHWIADRVAQAEVHLDEAATS